MQLPQKPMKTPRWITDDYGEYTDPETGEVRNQEQDMEEYFISYFFWQEWSGRESEIADAIGTAKAIAEAKYLALRQSDVLKAVSTKSVYLQLYKMQQGGWWQNLSGIEDPSLILQDILEDKAGGTNYEIKMVIQKLLPIMEQLGVNPAEVLGENRLQKAKNSVRAIEQIQIKYEDEEATEKTMETIQDIMDPTITVDKFNDRNFERIGNVKKRPLGMAGTYIFPDREIILIETFSESNSRAIIMRLRGLVDDIGPRDSAQLVKTLMEKVAPKPGSTERCKIRNGVFTKDPEGFSIPTNSRMLQKQHELVSGLIYVIPYIKETIVLPIHYFETILEKTTTFIKNLFDILHAERKPALEVLEHAMRMRYTIHPVMYTFFPNKQFGIGTFIAKDNTLHLALTIKE